MWRHRKKIVTTTVESSELVITPKKKQQRTVKCDPIMTNSRVPCSLSPDQLGFVQYFLLCPWRHLLMSRKSSFACCGFLTE